jgi:hypothetical protein
MRTSKLLPKECVKEIRKELEHDRKSKVLPTCYKDIRRLALLWVLEE